MSAKFFDIFQGVEKKEGKNPNAAVKIEIDYREKNSLVASELLHLGFEIEFKELKVADYIVNSTAIERKTISDFINSMINKRLLRQLEELQQYERKLLIVEGFDEQELYSDNGEIAGVHPNAIRGFLLSILLRFKIPIIFSKNYEDTAKFISVLAKKKSKEESIRASKKSLSVKEQIQYILEGFPGIGPKTAKKLLKEFSSIKKIINAEEEKLKSILGKKTDVFKKIIEKEIKN